MTDNNERYSYVTDSFDYDDGDSYYSDDIDNHDYPDEHAHLADDGYYDQDG